jgi:hypothetical protein
MARETRRSIPSSVGLKTRQQDLNRGSIDAAVALVETAPLLLTPGRKCQNGKLAPVDRADWKQYVADLIAVSNVVRKTAQERNFEAFTDISDKLNTACANCHSVYRDKGGSEGSGVGRC